MKNISYFVNFAINTQQKNFYIDVSFVKDNVWDKDALQELKFQLDELLIFYKKVYQDTGMLLGIGFLDRAMQNMIYGKRKFICFAGKNGFSITPSGIIYPCSRFYSVDKYKLYDSNVDTYFWDNIAFIKDNNVTENNKCMNCKINKFCNQGCYYSQLENESIIDGYCSVLKLIFKFTAGLYKEMKNECDVYITERKGVKF
jgi:radical SAM domain protein